MQPLRRSLAIACLVIISAALGSWAASTVAEHYQRGVAGTNASASAAAIESVLVRYRSIPLLLAIDPRIHAALGLKQDAIRNTNANLYLEDAALRGNLLAAYLLDDTGRTIAASNWRTKQSFVGQNYGFRPYFREAMSKGFGLYYAVGATTGEPGLFLSAAVKGERANGVLVVKVDLKALQPMQTASEGFTGVVDRKNVVFLSSDPAMLYRLLRPLDSRELAALRESQQYGTHSLALADGIDADLLVSEPVRGMEWSVVALPRRALSKGAAVVGGFIGGTLSVLALVVTQMRWWRRRRTQEILESRNELFHSEARLRAVADNLTVMVCFLTPTLRIAFANEAYARFVSRHRDSLNGQPLEDVLAPEEMQIVRPYLEKVLRGENVVFRREARQVSSRDVMYIEVRCQPEWSLLGNEIVGVHIVILDITHETIEMQRLARQAETDPLTQLLNRSGFERSLRTAMAPREDAADTCAALFCIDLDGFKAVNDSLGHPAGDALLVAFSRRLAHLMRPTDVAARFGGDEFAVVLADTSPAVVERLAQEVVAMAERPFKLEEGIVSIGATVGVAIFHRGTSSSAEELMRTADQMLYEAKRSGKRAFRISPFTALAGSHDGTAGDAHSSAQ